MVWGKEQVEAEILNMGQSVIVEELIKIPRFKHEMRELAKQFADLASVDDFHYPIDIMITYGQLDINNPSEIRRMEEYVTSLRRLADTYNLRCGWIIAGLHHMLRNVVNPEIKESISNIYLSWLIDRLKLDIPISNTTRKADLQSILDTEWKKLKSRHLVLQARSRVPEGFRTHVRWLCYRLFFGWTGKSIQFKGRVPKDRHYTAEYIDSAVYRAAKKLGITLPRGRPRKLKRR